MLKLRKAEARQTNYGYAGLTLYRASCFNVLIKQRDATLLINDLYYPLDSFTCFGLSPVHYQEHHLINCIKHCYVRAGDSSCCVDVHPNAGESSCCVDVHPHSS